MYLTVCAKNVYGWMDVCVSINKHTHTHTYIYIYRDHLQHSNGVFPHIGIFQACLWIAVWALGVWSFRPLLGPSPKSPKFLSDPLMGGFRK